MGQVICRLRASCVVGNGLAACQADVAPFATFATSDGCLDVAVLNGVALLAASETDNFT